jgi:hypothetical protein
LEKLPDLLKKLKYTTYIIFHPFDGFWELKRSRQGDMRSATVILTALIIVYVLRRQLTGFIFNFNIISDMNIFLQITTVALPFLLWCLANWSITTLVDGEGRISDIYITTAYALVPLIILNIPLVLLSLVITKQEGAFYNIIDGFSIVWSGLLLLIGIMTVHQFSIKKTLLTVGVAGVAMVVIVFIFMLFFGVIAQIINFVLLIYKELSMR